MRPFVLRKNSAPERGHPLEPPVPSLNGPGGVNASCFAAQRPVTNHSRRSAEIVLVCAALCSLVCFFIFPFPPSAFSCLGRQKEPSDKATTTPHIQRTPRRHRITCLCLVPRRDLATPPVAQRPCQHCISQLVVTCRVLFYFPFPLF